MDSSMDYYDLPTIGFRKDRWVSITRNEGFPAFVREHYTDARTGCYCIENIYVKDLK